MRDVALHPAKRDPTNYEGWNTFFFPKHGRSSRVLSHLGWFFCIIQMACLEMIFDSEIAFNSIISACAAASRWQEALDIFGFLETSGACVQASLQHTKNYGKTTIDIHIEMIFNGKLWISMAILLYWSSSPVTLKIDFHPYIYSKSPKMEQFETLKWYEMIGKCIIYTHWGVPSCEASPCGAQSDKLPMKIIRISCIPHP